MPEEKAGFPVSLMARIPGASRSGFCSRLANGRPEDGWSAGRDAVMRAWLESDGRLGFGFVHAMLPPEFFRLTRYRVLKLMREPGMRGCTPNARKRTAIPDPKAKPRPDLVRRDFTSPVPAYKFVGDIAYLRTGNCHDNAVAESFFATLKNGMYHRRRFPTRDAVKHAVIEFIEADYNRRRPHSTIGYQVPAQVMDSFFERTKQTEEGLPMAA